MTTETLPPEVWLRIFRLLSKPDVLNIGLVNKKFLSISSSPVLWREALLNRKKLKEPESCEEFTEIARFRSTRSVKITSDGSDMHINTRLEKNNTEQTEKILNNYFEICRVKKSIKSMRVRSFNLKSIETDIFVKIVMKLVKIDLSRSRLSEEQIIQIFEAIPCSKTVQSLDLSGIILSSIAPQHFAAIGETLVDFNLSHTLLTKEQSSNLLKGIAKSQKMKTLQIADIKFGLMEIDGFEFGMVISKNTIEMDLSNTQISQEALKSMMTKIMEYQCMESLNLSNIYLGQISARVLSSSLAFIPDLVLSGCFIDSSEALVTILEEIKRRKKVNNLDVSLNNMSTIDKNLLVDTFTCMEQLDLSQTSITKDQTKSLLTALCESSDIKYLKLNDNDVSEVDRVTLGKLVDNLAHLDLSNSNLQPLQIRELTNKGSA